MLESFTVESFVPYLNDPFWIRLADGRVETRLAAATPLGPGDAADGGRRPFSLLFHGPGRFTLPQQTYRVEHEALGEFDLFLVPIGPEGAAMRYEAVFT